MCLICCCRSPRLDLYPLQFHHLVQHEWLSLCLPGSCAMVTRGCLNGSQGYGFGVGGCTVSPWEKRGANRSDLRGWCWRRCARRRELSYLKLESGDLEVNSLPEIRQCSGYRIHCELKLLKSLLEALLQLFHLMAFLRWAISRLLSPSFATRRVFFQRV